MNELTEQDVTDVQIIEHFLHLIETQGHKVPAEVKHAMGRLYYRAFVVPDADYERNAENAKRVADAGEGL